MEPLSERRTAEPPYFSICIPQYNRTSFLLAALRSIERQQFRSFEICISDDVSTDNRGGEILEFLQQSGLSYAFVRQTVNQRYDGNLRAALALAHGRYAFLLGNDDGLIDSAVLGDVARALQQHGEPAVAVTNYRDAENRRVYERAPETKLIAGGPYAAVANFRHFSFVSGVILRTELAQRFATARYDGSEMYQVYLVTRAIAAGEALLALNQVAIDKDLRIPGESVDSYAAKPRLDPCPIVPRKFNLSAFPAVVSGALAAAVDESKLRQLNADVLQQLYSFTYPYWLIEFRRVQSWKYAAGIALGQRPKELMHGLELNAFDRARVRTRFLFSTVGGLLAPVKLTQRLLAPVFYRAAKRRRSE